MNKYMEKLIKKNPFLIEGVMLVIIGAVSSIFALSLFGTAKTAFANVGVKAVIVPAIFIFVFASIAASMIVSGVKYMLRYKINSNAPASLSTKCLNSPKTERGIYTPKILADAVFEQYNPTFRPEMTVFEKLIVKFIPSWVELPAPLRSGVTVPVSKIYTSVLCLVSIILTKIFFNRNGSVLAENHYADWASVIFGMILVVSWANQGIYKDINYFVRNNVKLSIVKVFVFAMLTFLLPIPFEFLAKKDFSFPECPIHFGRIFLVTFLLSIVPFLILAILSFLRIMNFRTKANATIIADNDRMKNINDIREKFGNLYDSSQDGRLYTNNANVDDVTNTVRTAVIFETDPQRVVFRDAVQHYLVCSAAEAVGMILSLIGLIMVFSAAKSDASVIDALSRIPVALIVYFMGAVVRKSSRIFVAETWYISDLVIFQGEGKIEMNAGSDREHAPLNFKYRAGVAMTFSTAYADNTSTNLIGPRFLIDLHENTDLVKEILPYSAR